MGDEDIMDPEQDDPELAAGAGFDPSAEPASGASDDSDDTEGDDEEGLDEDGVPEGFSVVGEDDEEEEEEA